jgi:flagella basal body P-ring formation protein FlgA
MQDAPNQLGTTLRSRGEPAPGLFSLSGPGLRRVNASALYLLACVVPAWAGTPAARPAADAIVLLHPTAIVTGDEVLLSDVAELTGEASELAGNWPVAAAPHPGTSGVIDAGHLQSVLSRRGVNLSNWIFRGASRCRVSRPAGGVSTRPRTASAVRPERVSRKAWTPGMVTTRPAASRTSSAETRGPDPMTLEGAIYTHIRERLGNLDGVLAVKFSPSTARLLALSTSQFQFRIADRGEKTLGMIPLEVTVIEKGQVQQVVQVVCEATLRKAIVVAGRPLNRGEIVQAGDLRMEARAFDKLEDIGLTDATPLVGQRVRRLIKFGEGISAGDFEPVPLVERNDLVTVTVRRGGLTVSATARAIGSGSYGETVSLRSELSKEIFVGMVTGPKTVELSDTQPGPATAVAAAGGRQ